MLKSFWRIMFYDPDKGWLEDTLSEPPVPAEKGLEVSEDDFTRESTESK